MTPKVLDLYHGDSVSSFDDIYNTGIRGIIHKATEGRTLIDSAYAKRREDALDAGLLWGAYHFLRPGNMKDQARRFVDATEPTEATLLAADHEDRRVTLSNLCDFLVEVYNETGKLAVLYSGFLVKKQLGSKSNDIIKPHRLWLAQYGPKPRWPSIWEKPFLWQYSDQGKVDGISGHVDVSSFDGTDEELAAQWTA